MNEQEFNESFHGKQRPIEEEPRVAYQLSMSAMEKAAESARYAGRLMLGSGIGALAFGGFTINYASEQDTVTATLCGIIAAAMGAGAMYARHRAGKYNCEGTRLRMNHARVKVAYDTYLKEEDLNQRRSQGHNI